MESKYLNLPQGRIHTLLAGQKENPPIILLHGYPASSHLWRNCIPALAEDFIVYAPDFPGYGRSDRRLDADHDLDFYVQFLNDFLDELKLDSIDLVGHDLGGMAGLSFVSRHPEKVNRFVVMDTGPYPEWPFLLRIIIWFARNPFFARSMLSKPIFKNIFKSATARPDALSNETIAHYRQTWIENPEARQAFSHVIKMPPSALTEPREKLRSISVPTLILWGQNDWLLPPKIAGELHNDIPGSQLVILPKCGHFLQEDNPEAVTAQIKYFFNEEKQFSASGIQAYQ